MKTKLFIFIFLLPAIIGCDNRAEQEKEEIPEIPVDTTVTWAKKMGALYTYLQSIPIVEMIKDYDYPPFIMEAIARYEADTLYQETLKDVYKIKFFAGELDSGERRFIKTGYFASCFLCYFYDENGIYMDKDNNSESGKSPIEVKNWKLIYFWGYYGNQ